MDIKMGIKNYRIYITIEIENKNKIKLEVFKED